MDLAALHPITGRQWKLVDDPSQAIWPDACLVVPFAERVKDDTKKVINKFEKKVVHGGWEVDSRLSVLELTDLVQNLPVSGVTAVWAIGPGGDMPVLHVLGDEPLGWLTPHLDQAAAVSIPEEPLRTQWFGPGPAEQFSTSRRFGEVVITPVNHPARLLTAPLAWLKTRMLQAPGAELSFSYPSGDPIIVDHVRLGVLIPDVEKFDAEWQPSEQETALPGGWYFGVLSIPTGGGTDAVVIPYGGSIVWVQYRHRPLAFVTPERITLQPGHYELFVQGTTTGKAPEDGLQNAGPKDWQATQRFWVAHPPSLRPYVRFSTVGDNRLFGPEVRFNPTLPGVGFPAHRDYVPVVRFCVPYVKGMFPQLRCRVDYADPNVADVVEDVPVAENKAGETTLPESAVKWKLEHGGVVPGDDEIVMTSALAPGPAALQLWHQPPAGAEFVLDNWAVHVSRFATAAEHLAWPATCLTRYYRSDGSHDHPPCATLAPPASPDLVTIQGPPKRSLVDMVIAGAAAGGNPGPGPVAARGVRRPAGRLAPARSAGVTGRSGPRCADSARCRGAVPALPAAQRSTAQGRRPGGSGRRGQPR